MSEGNPNADWGRYKRKLDNEIVRAQDYRRDDVHMALFLLAEGTARREVELASGSGRQ